MNARASSNSRIAESDMVFVTSSCENDKQPAKRAAEGDEAERVHAVKAP